MGFLKRHLRNRQEILGHREGADELHSTDFQDVHMELLAEHQLFPDPLTPRMAFLQQLTHV